MTIRGFFRFLFVASALAGVHAADASAASIIPGYPDNVEYSFDPREIALLPHYCVYTKVFRDRVPGGNNKAEIDRWYAVMGTTFNAVHHYCWALMKINRALLLAKDRETKAYYLRAAIADINYVLHYASRDFVLMPEILTKKGENLISLGRQVEGVTELERAIAIKPDYWPPYADLSDYYESTGDVVKARELLEKALTFAPDAKALTRRLAELDSAKEKKKPSQRKASGG
jgi:tetratricopeptide (TPR) repeat protein